MFSLIIETEGAAFDDAAPEVERLLNRAASLVRNGTIEPGQDWPLMDVNGNTCGRVVWDDDA